MTAAATVAIAIAVPLALAAVTNTTCDGTRRTGRDGFGTLEHMLSRLTNKCKSIFIHSTFFQFPKFLSKT